MATGKSPLSQWAEYLGLQSAHCLDVGPRSPLLQYPKGGFPIFTCQEREPPRKRSAIPNLPSWQDHAADLQGIQEAGQQLGQKGWSPAKLKRVNRSYLLAQNYFLNALFIIARICTSTSVIHGVQNCTGLPPVSRPMAGLRSPPTRPLEVLPDAEPKKMNCFEELSGKVSPQRALAGGEEFSRLRSHGLDQCGFYFNANTQNACSS